MILAETERQFLTTHFAAHPDIVAVYLFGSTATGRARPDSDLDLAVLLKRDVPEEEYLDRRLTLMKEMAPSSQREIDVVVLNEAGPVLLHHIFKDGEVLYCADRGAWIRFKAQALIDYVDWLPYKALLDRSVLRHFGGHSHG